MSTLTLTLPFQRELIYEDETIEFTEHQRDFLLTYDELHTYARRIPYDDEDAYDHDGYLVIPAVEYMPRRYRIGADVRNHKDKMSRFPFTPALFYTYFNNITVNYKDELVSKSSKRPICTKRPWIVFRDHARILMNSGRVNDGITPNQFVTMVEEFSGMSFIDGEVFANYFVYNIPLPSPNEFGLLGIDSWVPCVLTTINLE
ncbi:hypothetical protein VNI00_019046 [Paramarasmius palmivorus]|uniref:Uncharacterized protein n=1 Tax=Paramarasmius palmivorus TaxID=297713 RepID=A0AAW0AR67_9AGAR